MTNYQVFVVTQRWHLGNQDEVKRLVLEIIRSEASFFTYRVKKDERSTTLW